jgi:hypothetical protein
MTLGSSFWLTAGLALGGLHAASLWLAARRASAWIVATATQRLLVIGLVLIGAAVTDGLMSACVGWGVGLVGSAGLLLVRSRAP